MIKKIVALFFLLSACQSTEQVYHPKPKGFARLNLPAHQYQSLETGHPFSFKYSKAAIVQKDTTPYAEPHWLVVYYPELDARIQLTYKPLNNNTDKLGAHIADAFKLAAKHQVRATAQEESLVQLKNGNKAVVIEIQGEVPSHYQFYMTDTTTNFIRGAVYLKEATENDSLQPLVNYMKVDCRELIESLTWNKK